jgi:hypothetical protein
MKQYTGLIIKSILLVACYAASVSGFDPSDIIPPSLAINAPEEGSWTNQEWFAVSVSVDGTGSEVINITFFLDSVEVADRTGGNCIGGELVVCDFLLDIGLDGMKMFSVAATDNGGEEGNDATLEVSFTKDTVPPVISVSEPQEGAYYNDNTWPGTMYDHDSAASCAFSLDNGTTWEDLDCGNSGEAAEGWNDLIIRGTDLANNSGYSGVIHFNYDTVDPEMEIVSPSAGEYNGQTFPGITYSSDDAASCEYSFDDMEWFSISCGDQILPRQGNNVLSVRGYDLAENEGISASVSFTYDSIPPLVEIISPENGSYYSMMTWMSFLYSYDDATECWRSNDSVSWTAVMCGDVPDVTEGENGFAVRASDAAGNVGESGIIHFIYDSVNPVMSIQFPEEGGMYNAETWHGVNYTFDDAVDCSMTMDGVSYSDVGCGQGIVPLDGGNVLIIRGTDRSGNTADSAMINFLADVHEPDITVSGLTNGSAYGLDTWPGIAYTFDDAAVCSYSLDGGASFEALTCGEEIVPSEGMNVLVIRGTDSYNNSGSSGNLTFAYDTTLPQMTVFGAANNSVYGISSLPEMHFTADGAANCSISYDAGLTFSLTACNSSIVPPEGMNGLVVAGSDQAGNTGSSALLSFQYDATPPVVTLVSPENRTYNAGSIMLEISDNASGLNVTIDGEGWEYAMPTAVSFDDGEHRIVAAGMDDAGNAATDEVSFLVDTAPPVFVNMSHFSFFSSEGISLEVAVGDETSGVSNTSTNDSRFVVEGGMLRSSPLESGMYRIRLNASDHANNSAVIDTVLTALGDGQVMANASAMTLENGSYEVVVNEMTPILFEVIIPKSRRERNLSLNLTDLRRNGTVNLSLQVTMSDDAVRPDRVILANDTLLVFSGGFFLLQEVNSSEASFSGGTVMHIIRVGGNSTINLSRPAKIVLGGFAGYDAAMAEDAVLSLITTACDADLEVISSAGVRECSKEEGDDLIIWTYHLSKFAAVSLAAAEPIDEGDTGLGGGRGGGGGGGRISCETAWGCTAWGDCKNGLEKRSCKKIDPKCNVAEIKPASEQDCEEGNIKNGDDKRNDGDVPGADRGKKVLFDIDVKAVKKVFRHGDEEEFVVKLINVGDEGKVIAHVRYVIADDKGNSLYDRTESISVETQTEFVMMLESLPIGKYMMSAYLSYEGQNEPAMATEEFAVEEPRVSDAVWWVCAIVALLGMLALIGWKWRVKRMNDLYRWKPKQRMLDATGNDQEHAINQMVDQTPADGQGPAQDKTVAAEHASAGIPSSGEKQAENIPNNPRTSAKTPGM